uniref:Uncharacterized protein LOC111111578 n=1 Tax=Crassostrea virginica TaxID=6565 RepID=A0A8B8BNB1_CRAVI|nr:uncharacterized protein LOC111111578 [Crassostrea virginica]
MNDTRRIRVFFQTLLSFTVIICISMDDNNDAVYKTTSCPTNHSEWLSRSASIQCKSEQGYMCVPDENLTGLIEFCYKFRNIGLRKEHCVLRNQNNSLSLYSCRGFTSGCPNKTYNSNEMFNYPNCSSISNGCFLAEPSCESTSTQQPTLSGHTPDYTSTQQSTLSGHTPDYTSTQQSTLSGHTPGYTSTQQSTVSGHTPGYTSTQQSTVSGHTPGYTSTQQSTECGHTPGYILSQESEILTLRIIVIAMTVLWIVCVFAITLIVSIHYKKSK